MEKQKEKNIHTIRYLLVTSFFLVLAVVAVYIFHTMIPDVLRLLRSGDEHVMERYISEAGRDGVWILVVLQVLQTITIVFPGIPIYITAGIVYGKLEGTLICYLTYVISNAVIFQFSRRTGETAEALFASKKQSQSKIAEIMQRTKHPSYLVAALCVIPLIPNGIIPHIAAKSKLQFKNFLASVAVGCLPGIFLFICCGDLLMNGYIEVLAAICVAAVVLMVIAFLFKKKILEYIGKKM